MKYSKTLFLFLFLLLALNSLPNLMQRTLSSITFTKPTESSLWVTTALPTGLYNTHFWSLSTNDAHTVIAPFPSNEFRVYSLSSGYSARTNLDVGDAPNYDFFQRRHTSWGYDPRLIHAVNDNATIAFSGFQVLDDDLYGEGDQTYLGFTPYNVTGYIADFKLSAVDLNGALANFTALVKTDFQFASAGNYDWQTGQTTASWNGTMGAIVASSSSKPGYVAFATRLQSDTTGAWTFSYTIWNSSAAFDSWLPDRWILDNSTNGALPTTSTNIFGALAYDQLTDSGTYILHFTAYFTFAQTISELNTRLNQLLTLNPTQSYADSNTYWYDQYTTYSAVDLDNANLNKLYYWSKHLANVGHFAKRLFSAGQNYENGYLTYMQDASYAVFSSMATGQWDNAKRFLDNTLLYAIDTTGTNYDGFGSGTPYNTKNMVSWTQLPFATSNSSLGTARATLDFLDAATGYVAWSGNITFASANWLKLSRMLEAVYGATTSTGVLPLTKDTEDADSSLGCNIIYYHVLTEFTKIGYLVGEKAYASTLDSRASTLKTEFNKEVGSGGLWSTVAGYFVNSSSVLPADSNPQLVLWNNALVLNHDMANSTSRKTLILSAIKSKLEVTWGFNEDQFKSPARIWYMKNYELAKAFAQMEDSSKINLLIWSHINNPYSGATEAGTYTRFNFPEFWVDSGAAWGFSQQYAWSSSTATLAIEVLLGINPNVNNIKIEALKPSNITQITAINVKVRSAYWNISVAGNGTYVNSITIDSATVPSKTIPGGYYTGNHTVQVILGSSPISTPYTTDIVLASILTLGSVTAVAWYWRRKTKTRTVSVPP